MSFTGFVLEHRLLLAHRLLRDLSTTGARSVISPTSDFPKFYFNQAFRAGLAVPTDVRARVSFEMWMVGSGGHEAALEAPARRLKTAPQRTVAWRQSKHSQLPQDLQARLDALERAERGAGAADPRPRRCSRSPTRRANSRPCSTTFMLENAAHLRCKIRHFVFLRNRNSRRRLGGSAASVAAWLRREPRYWDRSTSLGRLVEPDDRCIPDCRPSVYLEPSKHRVAFVK